MFKKAEKQILKKERRKKRKTKHTTPTPTHTDTDTETFGGQKTNDEAQQCETTHDVCGKHGHHDCLRRGESKHIAPLVEDHSVHGWNIAALLREMAGLEGQALFECVERKFSFVRPKGASKPPDYGRQWPCSSWQKWKRNGWGKDWESFLNLEEGQRTHQICSSMRQATTGSCPIRRPTWIG